MRWFACLLCAIGVIGCGDPMPAMPAYAGTIDGVDYYLDPKLDITLELAAKQVRLTVEAWGYDMGTMQGVSVGYLSSKFNCGDNTNNGGCYTESGDRRIIRVLSITPECPYLAAVAHEVWHLLLGRGREPNAEEQVAIQRVQQEVLLEMLPYCDR
jgi:hypothetical protein